MKKSHQRQLSRGAGPIEVESFPDRGIESFPNRGIQSLRDPPASFRDPPESFPRQYPESFPPLGKHRAELKRLAEMPDEEIDTSDIPEQLDWSKAKRGRFNRGPQIPD